MEYKNLIIYYFSGTGNAKNAALWIKKVAREKGVITQLINIDRFEEIEIPETNGKTLIGFCSPTHGFNLPPISLKFVRKFPSLKNTDVFILNTRGGLKLSKLFLPGISGAAQILPAIMLRLKGFRIVGMQPLDLPSNWLILHPGLRENVVHSIYTRCHGITINFANKMLDGKRKYKALLSLPIDILMLPITFGYYFIGRFFLAKTLIATDKCTNCDKCIKQCPVKAINQTSHKPYWTYKCESCMGCVNACPERAIETTHAFAITLLILSSLVLSPLLLSGLKLLGILDWINQSFIARNLWTLIDALFFLLFVFMSYGILHYLMRFKFINRIIVFTSLSSYKFWRRYKAPTQH